MVLINFKPISRTFGGNSFKNIKGISNVAVHIDPN